MKDEIRFKKPLTLDEQIEHLKNNKRVLFNEIAEDEAKIILYEHNYINVITPFKHYFFKKYPNGEAVKDNNKQHIYLRDVEFKEYYDKYDAERLNYPFIYKTIINFETVFNSILSHVVIYYYNLDSDIAFESFQSILKKNIGIQYPTSNAKSSETNSTLNKIVDGFTKELQNVKSIFVFFDRLSLSDTLLIFRLIDNNVQENIFEGIVEAKFNFKTTNAKQFINKIFSIVAIRNCICHGNSIEILKRFYNYKDKVIRYENSLENLDKLITELIDYYK